MKQLYLIIAILLISCVSKAQTICDSCCEESFPYTFCSVLGGYQFTQCSSNPNADGNAVKSFIPSCVTVDQMRSDALWQPKGHPVAPAALLSNSDLADDTSEESGAFSQFEGDQTLSLQIPPQPPNRPAHVNSPQDSCGVDPYPPGTLVYPTRQGVLDHYLDDGYDGETYAEWNSGEYPVPPWKNAYKTDDSPNAYIWDNDMDEYDASLAQFCLDTSNFLNGLSPEHIDGADSGYDDNGIDLANSYYALDNEMLDGEYSSEIEDYNRDEAKHDDWVSCDSTFEADSANDALNYAKYVGAYHQYQSDSTAWMANVNSYVLVFDTTHAQADAQLALNEWLNLCTPPIQPCPVGPHDQPCCLHVVMDDDPRDFLANVTGTLAQTLTPGDTTGVLPCKATSCPSRIIEVNNTDEFISTERLSDSGSSPSQYTLYTVSRTEFYTGLTPPDTVAAGYSAYSFYQLMEHEIGHYLGLNHPEDTTGGHKCNNCYTSNPFSVTNVTGYRPVMAQNMNIPNPGYNSPVSLTSEDECQFQKLYCNTCEDTISHTTPEGSAPCALDDGVIAPADDEFKAEIYPNPTTGACQLQLEVPDRELVQVAIYDVLGNQIRLVSSGYEDEGPQSISLGTESLPSGNYVCRVRVGDRVSYINLAITK